MALACGIEGAHAHQTMHAAFVFQITVGVFTGDLDGNGADTGLIAIGAFHDFCGKIMAFAVAQVHAQQHSGPVTGLRATGSGVDGQVAACVVVRAIQQGDELELLQAFAPSIVFCLGFGGHFGFLAGHLNGHFHILQGAFQGAELLHAALLRVHFVHQCAGGFRVVPEVRGAHAGVQIGYFLFDAL